MPRVAHRSDPALVVLNGVRLKGLVSAPLLADATGLSGTDVQAALAELAGAGLVTERSGRVSGWSVTPTGREEHKRSLAADLATAACRDGLEESYAAFMGLNAELLATCTAWQVFEAGGNRPNDHSDADYDAAVMARLGRVDDGIQPTCQRIGGLMERLAGYGRRLSTARRRVEEGDWDWFTRPLFDSYHSVWFELHEDFLMTLALERASSPPGLTPGLTPEGAV